MNIPEFILRPGESVSVRLDVSGRAFRLDLSLHPEGLKGKVSELGDESAAGDLDDLSGLDDLAEGELEEYEDYEEATTEAAARTEEVEDEEVLDLDFGDLTGPEPADELNVEEAPITSLEPEEEPAPKRNPNVAAPSPPTLSRIEEEHPVAKNFEPGPDDTLPVWTGRARDYKDPDLEKNRAVTRRIPANVKKPITRPVKKPTGKPLSKAGGAGDGGFTVFLSPPKGEDKKRVAAEIIADLQDVGLDEALELAGKMIVPVAKGVSEDEANGIRDRFKDAGLSCRITQKR